MEILDRRLLSVSWPPAKVLTWADPRRHAEGSDFIDFSCPKLATSCGTDALEGFGHFNF
jgi:hypothetical protein